MREATPPAAQERLAPLHRRPPGCTVAEADAAFTDRPRFFTDLNVELIHELYLDGRLMLDNARSGDTRLTARAAPVDRDLRPGPTWDLPAPSADVTAEVVRLVADARTRVASPPDHILRRVAQRLRAGRMTSVYAGQVLVAAAETIDLLGSAPSPNGGPPRENTVHEQER